MARRSGQGRLRPVVVVRGVGQVVAQGSLGARVPDVQGPRLVGRASLRGPGHVVVADAEMAAQLVCRGLSLQLVPKEVRGGGECLGPLPQRTRWADGPAVVTEVPFHLTGEVGMAGDGVGGERGAVAGPSRRTAVHEPSSATWPMSSASMPGKWKGYATPGRQVAVEGRRLVAEPLSRLRTGHLRRRAEQALRRGVPLGARVALLVVTVTRPD